MIFFSQSLFNAGIMINNNLFIESLSNQSQVQVCGFCSSSTKMDFLEVIVLMKNFSL